MYFIPCNRVTQFWAFIFLILPNNTKVFSYFGKISCYNSLKYIFFFIKIGVNKPITTVFFYFYSGDAFKHTTLPQSRLNVFLHLFSLLCRQCPKSIVFVLKLQCNQACSTVHITWYERKRLILIMNTTIFV